MLRTFAYLSPDGVEGGGAAAPQPGVATGGSPPPTPESLAASATPASLPPETAEEKLPETLLTKKEEAAPVELFDPAKWKAPEGMTVDEAKMGQFTEIAKELNISHAGGEKLLGLYSEMQKAASEAISAHFVKTQQDWVAEVKADKEIGGDKLPSVLSTVSKALDQFGAPGIRAALELTGAGNNLALIKTLHSMAVRLTEGGHVGGEPAPAEKGIGARALYGHLEQKA